MADMTILPPEKKLIGNIQSALDVSDFNDFATMRVLKSLLLKDLVDRLQSGTMTHQEMAVAVRFLKDNGMTLMPYKEPGDGQEARPPVPLPDKSNVLLPSFDDSDGLEEEDEPYVD